jgi:hypothetical protein
VVAIVTVKRGYVNNGLLNSNSTGYTVDGGFFSLEEKFASTNILI